MHNIEELSAMVVDCGYQVHRQLGPGLLESVYELILAKMLEERGLRVERQKPISFEVCGIRFEEGFRADLLIEGVLLVELKSVEEIAPVHGKQVLTYLRLLNLPVGLLINFGSSRFKDGVKRVVNGHHEFTSSRLRVNQDRG